MFIFYFLLSISCFLSFLSLFTNDKIKKSISLLLFLILVIVAGTRIGVKGDFYNYVDTFNHYYLFSDVFSYSSHSKEPIYMLLSVFSHNFLNVEFFFFIIASISMFFTFKSYFKYTKYYLFSISIYLSFFFIVRDMGAIRAGVAYSIFIYSLSFLVDKKYAKFLFLTFISAGFHITTILALPISLLIIYGSKKITLIISIVLSIVVNVSGVSSIIVKFISITPLGIISSKVASYLATESLTTSIPIYDLTNLKNLTISFLLLLFYEKLASINRYAPAIITVYILGSAFRVMFSDFGVLIGRGYAIFNTVEPIVITYFLYILSFKRRMFLSLVYFLYLFIILYMGLSKHATLPYKSFMSNIF